jgi:hypothetical protein
VVRVRSEGSAFVGGLRFQLILPVPKDRSGQRETVLTNSERKVVERVPCSEVELLLYCARTHHSEDAAEPVRQLLAEQLDWNRLFELALQHRVLPLLYRSLSQIAPEAVPAEVMAQLRTYFHATARANLFLTRELAHLLQLLQTHGISALPFKGPVLASSIYGNLSLRQFADLDLMINQEDAFRARDLMLSQGFRLETPLKANGLPATLDPHEYHFVHEAKQFIVELRWQLALPHDSTFLKPRPLEGERQRVQTFGTSVPVLPPEELLLLLCEHGNKHLWSRLLWICDVAQTVRASPEMNWSRVQELARKHGVERRVAVSLLLAGDLLALALPEQIRRWAQEDRQARRLAAQVGQRLLSGADGLPEKDVRALCLYTLRVTERLADRVSYCLLLAHYGMTANERDRGIWRLPGYLSFVYPLIRPVRLMIEYVGGHNRSNQCETPQQ